MRTLPQYTDVRHRTGEGVVIMEAESRRRRERNVKGTCTTALQQTPVQSVGMGKVVVTPETDALRLEGRMVGMVQSRRPAVEQEKAEESEMETEAQHHEVIPNHPPSGVHAQQAMQCQKTEPGTQLANFAMNRGAQI